MVKDFIAVFEKHTSNSGAVAQNGKVTLFSDADSQQAKAQYNSFNYLEIVNDSDNDLNLYFDGLATRKRKLFGKSSLVIDAEDNIYFNNLQIENPEAVAVAIGELNAVGRIMKPARNG